MMMASDFHFRDKISVAILGALSPLGQRYVELLANHLWFQIEALCDTEGNGKRYRDAVEWRMPSPIPEWIGEMPIVPLQPQKSCHVIFSCLQGDESLSIEQQFVRNDCVVITHNTYDGIDLWIPGINDLSNKASILSIPNTTTTALSMALNAFEGWGIDAFSVVILESISKCKSEAFASFELLDNIIPSFKAKEKKIKEEILKIFKQNQWKIDIQHYAVPITSGEVMSVSIKLKNKLSLSDITDTFQDFQTTAEEFGLPTAPQFPIHYFSEEHFPQPALHRKDQKGMSVGIGELKESAIFDYQFTLLASDLMLGSVGSAILAAEMLVKLGHIYW